MKRIKITITRDVLDRYNEYYFGLHPKAKKHPIPHPYHESINSWMIMKRPMMNGLKQRWKNFITWYVEELGYSNLRIDECEIKQTVYYSTNRPHDIDNSTPKFILDGLVESGMVVSDDCRHVTKLTLQCFVDKENPRTELVFTKIKLAPPQEPEREEELNGKEHNQCEHDQRESGTEQ